MVPLERDKKRIILEESPFTKILEIHKEEGAPGSLPL